MLVPILTTNLESDLKSLLSNAGYYFGADAFDFQINFYLLNSVWKKYGLSIYNKERPGLMLANGNFMYSYCNSDEEDYSQHLFDGWTDIYEYYILSQEQNIPYNIRELESHLITSLVPTFMVFNSLETRKERAFKCFSDGVNEQLSSLSGLDEHYASVQITKDRREEMETFYTFERLVEHQKNKVDEFPLLSKLMWVSIIMNKESVLSNYFLAYNNLFELINSHCDKWRMGSLLFEESE